MSSFIVEILKDENGEAVLPLPDEIIDELGLKEGDVLVWIDNQDGTFSLKKKEK